MTKKMKDSGYYWIGEIPINWQIRKIKDLYHIQTGFTPDTKKEEYYADEIEGYDWLTIGDLDGKKYIPQTTKNHISKLYVQKFNPSVIPQGSLLYSFKLSVGQVSITNRDIYSNEAIAAFVPNNSVCLEFLYYSSSMIVENANENIYGAKILNQELIRNARVVNPPIDEQKKIALFLNAKCAELDNVLEKTHASIEEYKKLKQAVIAQAVTKGVRGNREMKDSGIEWIEEIPAEWKTIRIKWILNERKEKSENGEEEPLSMSQKYGIVPTKEMEIVPNMASSFIGAKIVYSGDLIFNKLKAHLGVFAVSEYDGLVSPDYAVYYSQGIIDVKYLEYLFKTPEYIAEFKKRSSGVGAGLTRLYTDELYDIYCLLPPQDEQIEITGYLNKKIGEIDVLIKKKEQYLSEIENYKKSLIYEYVTGKKEVPQE